MRLLFALMLVALAVLPSTMARPGLDDDAFLVTAAHPAAIGMFVPQRGRVTLVVDVAQGAYQGLGLHADDACRGLHKMGAAAEVPQTNPGMPVELPDRGAVTIQCGVMKAGWYILEFSVEAGFARVAVDASGARLA